jgi:hypothetical protein
MDDWAREHGEYANFICVCVQGADNGGAQMAQAMGKQMKLRNCVNGFIEHDEHMPSYGQLGCGGFIILDSEHRLVAKKTSAFMEVRELAFKHVETVITCIQENEPIPAVCPGNYCRLRNLKSRTDLNGQMCICLGMAGGRLQVLPMGAEGGSRRKPVLVAQENAERVNEDDDCESEDAGGGCGNGGDGDGGDGDGGCSSATAEKTADCSGGG